MRTNYDSHFCVIRKKQIEIQNRWMIIANKGYTGKNRLHLHFVKLALCSIFLFSLEKPILAALYTPKTDNNLIATKGKKTYTYKKGIFLQIKIGVSEKKVSGLLLDVSKDSIMLVIDAKRNIIEKISISDIRSISILHKKTRKQSIVDVLIIMIFFPLVLNASIGIFFVGKWWYTYLFFLLLGGMSFAFVYGGSYLLDIFSRKTSEKGWRFDSMEANNQLKKLK